MIVTEYVPVPELVVEPPLPVDPPVPPDPPLPPVDPPPAVEVDPPDGAAGCPPPPQPRSNPITSRERKDLILRECLGDSPAKPSQSSPITGKQSDSDALNPVDAEDRGLAVMVNTE